MIPLSDRNELAIAIVNNVLKPWCAGIENDLLERFILKTLTRQLIGISNCIDREVCTVTLTDDDVERIKIRRNLLFGGICAGKYDIESFSSRADLAVDVFIEMGIRC